MAYRRRPAKRTPNKNKRYGDQKRVVMLNMRSLTGFRYYLREILEESTMAEEYRNAFMANLVTKGSRGSLAEAKEYVRQLSEEEKIDEESCEKICSLLDRNRKFR